MGTSLGTSGVGSEGFEMKMPSNPMFGGVGSQGQSGKSQGTPKKSTGGFGGGDDLFSNVWE
jgi:hypothetical protein